MVVETVSKAKMKDLSALKLQMPHLLSVAVLTNSCVTLDDVLTVRKYAMDGGIVLTTKTREFSADLQIQRNRILIVSLDNLHVQMDDVFDIAEYAMESGIVEMASSDASSRYSRT